MAKVINLNRARKKRARDEARTKADENAIRFGRNRSEKVCDQAENKRKRDLLDNHKLID